MTMYGRKCNACGADIVFVPTRTPGKSVPLDAEAVADGNIVVRLGFAVVEPETRFLGEPMYKSHFATCPQAERFRR